jgi:hypothetical protein
MMEKSRRARLWNQRRLRQLRAQHQDDVTLFCAHDTVEFERSSQRSFDAPVPPLRLEDANVELVDATQGDGPLATPDLLGRGRTEET